MGRTGEGKSADPEVDGCAKESGVIDSGIIGDMNSSEEEHEPMEGERSKRTTEGFASIP